MSIYRHLNPPLFFFFYYGWYDNKMLLANLFGKMVLHLEKILKFIHGKITT